MYFCNSKCDFARENSYSLQYFCSRMITVMNGSLYENLTSISTRKNQTKLTIVKNEKSLTKNGFRNVEVYSVNLFSLKRKDLCLRASVVFAGSNENNRILLNILFIKAFSVNMFQ